MIRQLYKRIYLLNIVVVVLGCTIIWLCINSYIRESEFESYKWKHTNCVLYQKAYLKANTELIEANKVLNSKSKVVVYW